MQTERLTIAPLTASDSYFIFELVNSEGWIRFIGDRNVHTLPDAEKYIQKILNNIDFQYFVCRLKSNNEPVGVITLIKRDYLEHRDIGFALLPRYARMGYAFEASQRVLEELIVNKQDKKIVAITLESNILSISLLQKLGLTFEKEIHENNEELFLYGMNIV